MLPTMARDDEHFVPVDARLSYARAAIDWHECGATVGGDGDFVTVNADGLLGDSGNLAR